MMSTSIGALHFQAFHKLFWQNSSIGAVFKAKMAVKPRQCWSLFF